MCSQTDENRSHILIQGNELERTNYGIHIESKTLTPQLTGISLEIDDNCIKNQYCCAIHIKNLYFTSLTISNNIIKNCSVSGCSLANLRCLKTIRFFKNEILNNERLGLSLDTTFPIKIKNCKFSNSKCGIWYINKISNFFDIPQTMNLETINLFTGSVQILHNQFTD